MFINDNKFFRNVSKVFAQRNIFEKVVASIFNTNLYRIGVLIKIFHGIHKQKGEKEGLRMLF